MKYEILRATLVCCALGDDTQTGTAALYCNDLPAYQALLNTTDNNNSRPSTALHIHHWLYVGL